MQGEPVNEDFRVSVHWHSSRKRRRLAARLGPAGVVAVIDLWAFTARSRPDGLLRGLDGEDIEMEAGWQGEPGAFLDAITDPKIKILCGPCEGCRREAGLPDDTQAPYVHGWHRHNRYASFSEMRSRAARHAADIRWKKKRLMPAASEGNADSEKGNPPSPSPSPSPSPDPTPSPDPFGGAEPRSAPLHVVRAPLKDGGIYEFDLTEVIVSYQPTHDHLDIRGEILRAVRWLEDNPEKRKTCQGMPKFLTNWLNKSHNEYTREKIQLRAVNIPTRKKTADDTEKEKQAQRYHEERDQYAIDRFHELLEKHRPRLESMRQEIRDWLFKEHPNMQRCKSDVIETTVHANLMSRLRGDFPHFGKWLHAKQEESK
jgi:hypothetical protein